MSTIQPKHMINKVIDTAAKNKNTVTLNLNEIERTVAKNTVCPGCCIPAEGGGDDPCGPGAMQRFRGPIGFDR